MNLKSDVGTSAPITRAERESQLDAAQPRQSIGLTDHDASGDPFPVTAPDAGVIVWGNASQSTLTTSLP